jgi:hypothetical protein
MGKLSGIGLQLANARMRTHLFTASDSRGSVQGHDATIPAAPKR